MFEGPTVEITGEHFLNDCKKMEGCDPVFSLGCARFSGKLAPTAELVCHGLRKATSQEAELARKMARPLDQGQMCDLEIAYRN